MNTYMVAIQVTIKPTIYVEVIAESAEHAKSQVEAAKNIYVSENLDSIKDEAKIEVDGKDFASVKTISCGRANQYHSDAECKLCRSIK